MNDERDPIDPGPHGFGEKLLTLLEEGAFSTTYKLAVLLALTDLCLEHSDERGHGPSEVSTRDLAVRVIEIYWPQATVFPSPRNERVLGQSGRGKAEILESIVDFRRRFGSDPSAPISEARRIARFEALVDEVEWKLVEMPLPRLQLTGKTEDPFLYRISWTRDVKRADLRSGRLDRRIRFAGRSSDYLIQFAGLLRPLVQRKWAQMVAKLNKDVIEDSRIEDFLFGAKRVSLVALQADLRELQSNRCFYCDAPMRGRVEVDHFIPWARHPDNSIENLVIADARCNNDKRDFIASTSHTLRWSGERAGFAASHASQLSEIARSRSWDSDPSRVRSIARSIYLRLPNGKKLWRERDVFEDFDPTRWRSTLAEALQPGNAAVSLVAEGSPSYEARR